MPDSTEDTVPMPVIDDGPPWAINREDLGWDIDGDGEINEIEAKVPEPALLRGVIVAGAGLVAAVVGKSFDLAWIDETIGAYIVAAPLVLAWWIRRNVSPTGKHRAK